TFANPFGLAVLDGFLYQGHSIGELLARLRRKNLPLGLLYGTYCPPNLQVPRRTELGTSGPEATPGSQIVDADQPGKPLKPPPGASEPPLPPEPYLPLSTFGPEHRALFAGREEDVVRFASLLGDHVTRMLVLHGESGVGKSSFLRAGVIPYLERDC